MLRDQTTIFLQGIITFSMIAGKNTGFGVIPMAKSFLDTSKPTRSVKNACLVFSSACYCRWHKNLTGVAKFLDHL